MPRTVLVAEDERVVARGLKDALEFHGHRVEIAEDGPTALELVRTGRPDLLVLDIMLPGLDGFEVCRRLREEGNHIPTLMLTARAEEEDRVRGLNVGADDYVVKPFSVREVVARVEALFRRLDFDRGAPTKVRIGAARIDFQSMIVHRDGDEPIDFPEKEAGILRYLLENPDRIVTRDELLLNVWHYPVAGIETRTVDNYIVRLRTRVEPDPKQPTIVLTVRGRGYRLGEAPR